MAAAFSLLTHGGSAADTIISPSHEDNLPSLKSQEPRVKSQDVADMASGELLVMTENVWQQDDISSSPLCYFIFGVTEPRQAREASRLTFWYGACAVNSSFGGRGNAVAAWWTMLCLKLSPSPMPPSIHLVTVGSLFISRHDH
jgi:hypothetical protein